MLEREAERIDDVVTARTDRVGRMHAEALAASSGSDRGGRDDREVERRGRVERQAAMRRANRDTAKDRVALVRVGVSREERRLIQDADAIGDERRIRNGPAPAV